jgi:hypothetical protein
MIVGNDDGEEDSKEHRLPNLYTSGAGETAGAREESILTGGPGD